MRGCLYTVSGSICLYLHEAAPFQIAPLRVLQPPMLCAQLGYPPAHAWEKLVPVLFAF